MEVNFSGTSYSGGGNYKKSVDPKKLGKIVAICAVVALLLIGAFSCFYTVDDKQQAVATLATNQSYFLR